jgi:regulator of sirC expression with transglutaminase-like and TPR domain
MEKRTKWDRAPLREVVRHAERSSEWRSAERHDVEPRGNELTCSLEEGALVLARQEYPELDPQPWLTRLDGIADLARPMLSGQPDPPEAVGVLNDVLFRDLGFHGNQDEYYDPRNSFLNDVLERRSGIPISLSTVYMAVARRIGLPLRGTAFPGHFLVVHERAGWPIVIDAFDRGRILTREDCEERLTRLGGPGFEPLFLAPVSDLAILRRMLNNLKMIYFGRRDWERLLRTAAQMLVVTPEDHDEHFTCGVALAGIGEVRDAIGELQRYLALRPETANRDEVLDLLSELRRRLA